MKERSFHYLPTIAMLYVTSLLIANIAAIKLIQLGPVLFPAGLVIFPFSYIFDDILTEVYGYEYSRRIIWTGLASLWSFCLIGKITTLLPAAPFWHHQESYAFIMNSVPRLLIASSCSYLCSEFLNSYLLAKLKIATQGKHYWLRLLLSTAAGSGVDTLLFCLIAFLGSLSFNEIYRLILWQWIIKVGYEVIVIPITYLITNYLKKKEHSDYYDQGTNFNPFSLEIKR